MGLSNSVSDEPGTASWRGTSRMRLPIRSALSNYRYAGMPFWKAGERVKRFGIRDSLSIASFPSTLMALPGDLPKPIAAARVNEFETSGHGI